MPLSSEERKRVEYLQQKLNFFRVQLEKLERYLEGVPVDPTNANMRLEGLVQSYEAALEYSEELSILQSKNPQLDIFIGVESRYFEAASTVKKLQAQESSRLNNSFNASGVVVTERQERPRLPKIKIPTFDGKQENWAQYKNKFIALVDSCPDISDAVKCTHLLESLEGSALAKVAEFDPSGADYPKAWKTLLDFYDHKRVVAGNHLNAMLDLPQLTKASADDLSALWDKARQHLSILERLGARDSDEHVWISVLERCLPPALKRRWQDRLEMNELPKLDDFFKFLQMAIYKQQDHESSETAQKAASLKRKLVESHTQSSFKRSKGTAHSFLTSNSPSPSTSSEDSMSCPKCRDSHRLFRCPIFNGMAVQDKWQFIRSIKACQNCLWAHPFSCKSDRRCKKCGNDHHTLLHNDRNGQHSQSGDSSTLSKSA